MLYYPSISQDPITTELQSNSKDGVSRGEKKNHTSNKKQTTESKEGGRVLGNEQPEVVPFIHHYNRKRPSPE